jgi:hypothetical protein
MNCEYLATNIKEIIRWRNNNEIESGSKFDMVLTVTNDDGTDYGNGGE